MTTDNSGASIVLGYGSGAHAPARRVKTIPLKPKKGPDNYQELESANVGRKSHLAAHTSRQGVSNLRPGRVSKQYTEAEVLKMFYDHVAKEEANANKRANTMFHDHDLDIEDEVLAKIEAGDWDGADRQLDDEIFKLAERIQKAKRPWVNVDHGPDDENDNIANATGEQGYELDDDDEESTPLPVKAKKAKASLIYPHGDIDHVTGAGADNAPGDEQEVTHHTQQVGDAPFSDEDEEDDVVGKCLDDQEAAMAKRAEYDALDSDTEQMMKVSRLLEASGSHDIRKRAVQATLDALEQDLAKLGSGKPVRYPSGQGEGVLQHNRSIPSDATRTSERGQASRQLSVTPVIPENVGRHKFDDLVDQVCARDNCSRSKAFTTARLEHPSVYDSYQAWNSSNTAQEQQAVRSETYDPTNKRAPLTYESAVNAEMKKYNVSPTVAGHRVLQRYGNLPSERFNKAADVAADWREAAQAIADRDGIGATDALRKCRLERPELHRALQGRV
jgi:hypothetical protein